MTITFFINYLNHHQVFVADEMYRQLGDDFRFVATYPRNAAELKGGIDYSIRPYCLLPAERESDMVQAQKLVVNSDVCVFGAGNLNWEYLRAKTDKLSFEISERWFKRGIVNIMSPRLLRWWWLYQTKLRKKPFYMLCASAYTASDCRKLLTFKGRCFKWGYLTDVPPIDIDEIIDPQKQDSTVRILWVARFLPLKHPEKMLQLAKYLLKSGYSDFVIDMIGVGPEYEHIAKQILQYGLSDFIRLLGQMPNDKVLRQMQDHDIFCFTSDRKEGWGAVLNEAMSNGCCVVANDEIGAVPYLIKSGTNGLIYHKGKGTDLNRCVEQLLRDRVLCRKMSRMAYNNMQCYWNPITAAKNLIDLSRHLMQGHKTPFSEGPCSIA